METKILILGACPPPYTGQSISLEKLKDSLSKDINFKVQHVDLAPKKKHTTGRMNFFRASQTLLIIINYIYFLINFKPEVIYLTKGSSKWGFMRDYVFLLLQRILCRRAKFIVHLKGGNYDIFYNGSSNILKYFIRDFLRKSFRVIVLGPSLVKMYDFCPEINSKIRVLYNALPQEENINFIEKENDELHVTFLSNMILSKGYMDILYASTFFNKEKVHFHFAGQFMLSPDDENAENVEERKKCFLDYIEKHNLSNSITYHDVLIGKAKNKLLEISDVFILPTYYHVEGQPISIIEAMSFSNAIIATEFRSIPDIVGNNENGIFIRPKTPDDIVLAIRELFSNKEKIKRYQFDSYQKYINRHTWDQHYRAIVCIFKEE